ncbi:MAG: hypothetical protein EBZ69_10060 [Alphaproteobacteria bacterium]|nr:hypothetical protein [Alphaproteobacteria bacterium]
MRYYLIFFIFLGQLVLFQTASAQCKSLKTLKEEFADAVIARLGQVPTQMSPVKYVGQPMMKQIISRNAPLVREEWRRDQAIQFFEQKGEAFKVELIRDLPETEVISIYRQGEWLDLCRGPHMPSTSHVGNAFKLMKVAGAYWRGDSKRPMLQRIYGTAWRDEKELQQYLTMLEEAEKRDHRKLGRELDLFHFQDEAAGSVFWHAKGWTVFRVIMPAS